MRIKVATATSTGTDSGAGATSAAESRTVWQQTMAAQFDIGAFAGFGAAPSWQAAVCLAPCAVARQWAAGDQVAARKAAISAMRGIDDSIADAAGDIKGLNPFTALCLE